MRDRSAEACREEIGRGAVLVMEPHPGREIVAVHIFLRMGSLYETDEQSGISNLMQNLLLKGTETLDAEELDERLDGLGSRLYTSTGKEVGSFSLLTTRETLDEALDLAMGVLTRPRMSEPEFEKEREFVLYEIPQRRDELLSHAIDLFQNAFYGDHPLRKVVQGDEGALRSLTRDDVAGFRERAYVPGNMVVACAGGFDPERMLRVIERSVADLPDGDGLEPAEGSGSDGGFPRPGAGGGVRPEAREERESSAAWIVLGYPAPSVGEEGYLEMQVINAMLGGSMDSRLFARLREEQGLAYQVSSVYRTYTGPSFLAGYIGTDPRKYGDALRALTAEIEKVAVEAPEGEELLRTKDYLKGAFLIGGETMSARAARRGKFELLGLGHDYGTAYLEGIDRVTSEGVRQVAETCFRENALGAVIPRGAAVEAQ
jgi:predicted Zn-dependent peptidase